MSLSEDRRLRHVRLKEILFEATRLRGPERDRFVRSACGGDEGLREELESLLAYHEDLAVDGYASHLQRFR